jgi:hypothetical protein
MKRMTPLAALWALLLFTLNFQQSTLHAQGTAFTYQGQLQADGSPATGLYDIRASLWSAISNGTMFTPYYTNTAVAVTNGLFIMTVDFGSGVWSGGTNWLQIGVRTNGAAAGFTALSPRQMVTPTPYAIFAETSSNLSGTLPVSQLPAVVVTNNASGLTLAGTFSGNGAGVTNLNASNLASGTVPDAQLASDVALTDASQTFTGTNIFITGTNAGSRLIVHGTTGIDTSLFTGLGFQYASGTGEGAIMSSYNDDHASLTFYTKPGSGVPVLEQAKIDRYGDVLIDQQNANSGVIDNGNTNGAGLLFGVGGGEGIASQRTAGVASNSLDFYTAATNRMTILNNGNVGINTNHPGAQLDVDGTVNAAGTLTVGATNSINRLFLKTLPGYGFSHSDGTCELVTYVNGPGGVGGQIGTFTDHPFGLFVNNGNPILIIATNNNVGINKNSPATALDVAGTVNATAFTGNGSGLTGLEVSQLPATVVTNDEIGVTLGGAFAGDGSNLTNLNASQLSSGTIPNSVLSGFQGDYGSESGFNTVGGGYENDARYFCATVGGGYGNNASYYFATVGGGANNIAGYYYDTVAGGWSNTASAYPGCGTVGGGEGNTAGPFATVSGGTLNTASAYGAFIGGGGYDGSDYEFFFGYGNIASGAASAIVGGMANDASGKYAAIGGGEFNTNSGEYAVIGGGEYNTNGSNAGTISGGQNNLASGQYQSTVGGGYGNQATGSYATIPGGENNLASGELSFAAGGNAHAVNDDTFVWSDDSATTTSTANDQFMVRASGGVIIYSSSGTGSGVSLAAGSGTWSNLSDRNAKDDFTPVTSGDVLARVAALPITRWSYKTEPGVRHLGPMAQDFHAAFALGEDDRHITEVDEGGVALAAIQGLNQKLEAEAKQKDAKICELEKRLNDLEQMVQTLAAKK